MNQSDEPVVRARGIRKDYGSGEGLVRAVDGIDLDVIRGETLAVMGPSGCGKSTLLHLMDELTVLENVEFPTLLAGGSPRAARRRAAELLEQVGLTQRTAHLPTALSGGQRQRVAIARALANDPVIVFADEPTGNLDSVATTELLRLFDALHTSGLTLVIVTHDERVAATADRLISMRDGAFVGDTRLAGGTTGNLARLAGLDG